ncbi:MAG: TraR/DksA family transcriptional regulator [Candidatus Calescibacterium sp.]|jgi:DnaK suppressor protein|nr:TraR/DksA family transcriptional regulator [Candidatus Calescibacterium sp.]
MTEFERKMKKKLEEMRAYVRSRLHYTPNIPQEERADIIDLTSAEKIRDIERIITSIDTDVLKLIERALDKINSGTYGYCENCGVRIDKERLEEVPYVRYCIDCQERIELGERVSRVGEEEISHPPIKFTFEDTSIEIEPEESEEETLKVKEEEGEEEEGETSLEEEILEEEIGEERLKEAENLDKEIEEEIEEELEEELREEQYIEEPPEEEEEEPKEKRKKETRKTKIASKRKKSKLAKPKTQKEKKKKGKK